MVRVMEDQDVLNIFARELASVQTLTVCTITFVGTTGNNSCGSWGSSCIEKQTRQTEQQFPLGKVGSLKLLEELQQLTHAPESIAHPMPRFVVDVNLLKATNQIKY